MVRKIMCLLAILCLCAGYAGTAQAASYTAYEGNPSNTYITYFRDIVSGIGFNDNYVAFRSGQYEYILVVGELQYDGQIISLVGQGKQYVISTESGYNSYYSYSVSDTNDFSLRTENKIVYSDVGEYPQLVERGAKYEMLNTLLICIGLLGIVISRIFRHC